MPGIFVQTSVFGATGTGIGLAEDLHKGLIERFRSLPMARSAVLVGRTWADVCRNVVVLIVMASVGFLVGFRIHEGFAKFVLSLLLILFFGYSFSWVTAMIGLTMPTSEAAQAAIFPILFPLTFASSAFVPVQTMPSWLQVFAEHQPVTIVVNAARGLTGGPEVLGPGADVRSYVIRAVLWSVGIIAVFAPLAVRRFRRAV
jgi:ABC-2 type transport system permease protein/oleandomycin transport system permease protein